MDQTTREFFESPLHHARVPDPSVVPLVEQPPFVKILADSQQKLLLLRGLARSGRLQAVRDVPASRLEWGAGLFCVAKDGSRDRLVLDARPANQLEDFPGRWVHTLASASCLSGLVLKPSQCLIMRVMIGRTASTNLRPLKSGLCGTTWPAGYRTLKLLLSSIVSLGPSASMGRMSCVGSLRSLWVILQRVSLRSAATWVFCCKLVRCISVSC